MSIGSCAGHFIEGPEGAPEWKLRAFLVLLFPK